MLIALKNNEDRVIATESEKDGNYTCPGCNEQVILKKGRIVIHHFSHKPLNDCSYGNGESQLHLRTKLSIFNHLKTKNVENVELEKPLGSNRPDVYFEKDGLRIAIEVQISSLSLELIEKRTRLYHEKNIHVFWISPIEELQSQLINGQIIAKSWQKFIHGLYYGKIFYWDKDFVTGISIKPAESWIEQTDWGGGYYKTLKRRKNVSIDKNSYNLPEDFICDIRSKWNEVPSAHIMRLLNFEEKYKISIEKPHEHKWYYYNNTFYCEFCPLSHTKCSIELYNRIPSLCSEEKRDILKLFLKLFPEIKFDLN